MMELAILASRPTLYSCFSDEIERQIFLEAIESSTNSLPACHWKYLLVAKRVHRW
jgi:hypothetical protein